MVQGGEHPDLSRELLAGNSTPMCFIPPLWLTVRASRAVPDLILGLRFE